MKKFYVPSCPVCQVPFVEGLTLDRTPKEGTVIVCQAGAWWHIIGNDNVERLIFVIPMSKKP